MYQEDAEHFDHQQELVRIAAERRKDTGMVTDTSQYPWIEEDEVLEGEIEEDETDSEAAAEELLRTILEDAYWVDRVRTFEESGVLTYNKGLVITTRQDEEYQLTIVRSR